ncbi:cell migration-inducing and hyaluronan-binding protein-like [Saccostrea echinata]|uniref:cell migration-inducing and hyaluronan-binding protein-like n=1 Tax=Saccostrea echinata TaxID=191078 RepID=UPI002A8121BD|nr:cell migration-inducing and hyaluronan-binding protein-like [Saccostrea echinata]
MELMVVFGVLICCSVALAVCPDDATDLNSWAATYGTTPSANITLTQPMLLDTSVELFGLTIASGGRLVWSRQGNYGLRTHYIRIQNGGELHIGSQFCRFNKKAHITLLGEPDEKLNIPGFGEKFIGVEAGGVLNLYGKEKLSWTKLTKHVHKFDKTKAEIYNHREEPNIFRNHGLYIYHFKEEYPANFDIENDPGLIKVNSIYRKLSSGDQNYINTAMEDLVNFINTIPDGDIYAIATQRHFLRDYKDYTMLYDAIDGLGTNSLRTVESDDAYVAVGKKGDRKSYTEKLVSEIGPDGYAEAMVVYYNEDRERELVVSSINYLDPFKGKTQFLAVNTLLIRPIISVVDQTWSWKTGDRIFITSTDYDWKQVEEFTIIPCKSPLCSPTTVRLDHPAEYDHYGEIYKRVDMRAEVGLMTRNILIDAEVSEGNNNGGHIKFLYGFKDVRVEGTEITNMGHPLILGRYPLHYHMCEDLGNRTLYARQSVIRKNSIHHTQFRCVTIHGTHSARLLDNVCYDTVGHGFFLEDGGEKHTYFRGNLGLGQRDFEGTPVLGQTGAIPTDQGKGPVTFWITNPITSVINNVAAGSQGIGMWFTYPDLPTGPSRTKNFMQEKEARRTKIKLFKNNVFHSNANSGLFVDNIEHDNLTVSGYNMYNPIENPKDLSSKPVPAVFERITAYKNRVQNAWIRGTPMIVTDSSFADSLSAAIVIKESDIWVEFSNNVVLGYTDNLGSPKSGYTRSFPNFPSKDVVGYRFNKGPVFVMNTWFDDFTSTSIYQASALTNKLCFSHMNAQNQVKNLLFGYNDGPDNRFRFRQNDQCTTAADAMFSLKDIGNDLTGSSGPNDVTLVLNIPFHVTGQCKVRNSWNIAYCPYNYGEIQAIYPSNEKLSVYRVDGDSPQKRDLLNKEFLAILGQNGNNFLYLMVFENGMPAAVHFEGRSVTKSDTAVMAYCIPRDSVLSVAYKLDEDRRPTELVNTLDEVLGDTEGGKFFFDRQVGAIFFKMIHVVDYAPGEKASCPSGHCPRILVRIVSGNMADTDCSSRFFAEPFYQYSEKGSPTVDNNLLQATATEPPENWGAGSTYPQPY